MEDFLKNINIMKLILILIPLSSLGAFEERAVGLNTAAIENVWTATERWNEEYESKYRDWLVEMLPVTDDGVTLMYQDHIEAIEKRVTELKRLSKPFHVDCADNVILFRILFAREHGLPFMMKAYSAQTQSWWFIGHFGFREASNFNRDSESKIRKSYYRYGSSFDRLSAFIWDMANNFGVVSFSSTLGGASGDVYDIDPRVVRGGDIFIEAEFGRGGHSLSIAKVDYSKAPFLDGYSYHERKSLAYLIASPFNNQKGAGLKRWKWTEPGRAYDGSTIWINKVQPGDAIYQADYDQEGWDQKDRRSLFINEFTRQLRHYQVDGSALIKEYLEILHNKLKTLAQSPSSCNNRKRINTIVESVQLLKPILQSLDTPALDPQVWRRADFFVSLWNEVIHPLFPWPLDGYRSSALCGWNSSNSLVFVRVLYENRGFVEENLQSYLSEFGYFDLDRLLRFLGVDKTIREYSHEELSSYPTSESKTAYDIYNDHPLWTVDESSYSYYQYYPFTHENICMFVPNEPSLGVKWQPDEGWLKQDRSLWPACY